VRVRLQVGSVLETPCDVLIVNLFEGVSRPGGATGAVDRALGGLISAAIAAGDCKGEWGESTTFYAQGRLPARKVLVAGLGRAAEWNLRRARLVAAAAVRAARKGGARCIASIAHGAGTGGLEPGAAAQFVVDGALHGLYTFPGYKEKGPKQNSVEEFVLVEADPGRAAAMQAGLEQGVILAEASNWARSLGERPHNHLTAPMLAEEARLMAASTGLECEVLEQAALREKGFGLLLAVNQGSVEPARCITLSYHGAAGKGRPRLALVGKGIVFDTGGISIKPAEKMWEMKYDMLGAAAVLGAMRAIAALRPALDVIGIVVATDNAPDGAALKPGDVVHGLSGKTVEIRSTDAEGRLVLGDGVAWARRLGATRILEVSTLTGTISRVLGKEAFGSVANDPAWQEQVLAAAAAAGERVWPLPVYPEYRELYRSHVADLTNGGSPDAGASTGGMIILEHAGDTPAVHLDIAGTAWITSATPQQEAGPTGVALRTLVQTALALAGA